MFARRTCPDCGVEPGERHLAGCDEETCPVCGLQFLSCGHPAQPPDDRIPWAGRPPGIDACIRNNLFARLGHDGWIPCGADEPGATYDLNRLYAGGAWDRAAGRWTYPAGDTPA